jgi:predicted DCC family thiol-disulfide oxidoreductase YuxK
MTAVNSTTSVAPLPTPVERPEADIVIYDGHCRICTSQIRRLAGWDAGGRLAYLSLHDPETARRFPDLSHDELMQYMVLVDRRGRRYRGAEVLRYLSRRLPLLWWAAPILHLPLSMPAWQWCYRQVAKRRYRFGRLESCDDGSCRLHG